MTAFAYSVGANRYDARPTPRRASNLREFARDLLAHRAPTKARARYVCPAFGGDGRRCAANALPRAWLALDVDGIDPDALVDWRLWLTHWRGFGWPTASSSPNAPRERVIIELSEAVGRAHGIALGALVTRDVDAEFGAAVRVDPCTFRAEQPCFLPVGDVPPFYLLGDALDVPTWIAQAPEPPPEPPPLSEAAAAVADVCMRALLDSLGRAGLLTMPLANSLGYAMRCPWEAAHTERDAPGNTATAVFFPAEANGWRGGFRCLHAHCAERSLRDLVQLLALAEREPCHER